MKINQTTCDLRRLDLFLRGRLPHDYQEEIEMHLQACPACRDQLDELAGGTHWWSAVRENLGDDGAMSLAQTTDPILPSRGKSADPALECLQPSSQPGSLGRLGTYEVLEVLGRGGMGIVLRAFDPALHRPVAIKVLSAEYAAHGTARQRFAREARAAAAVVHDHVVPVHAVDADAPLPYLVMGFIPGRSLQERIDASGPLGLREILRISMQTAYGLAAAHAQGLVHRDIKPANIMLENGIERVRITDFGLARAVDDASVTQSGAVAGTPQYMAPEQARGEVIDQRADLYSLGSTMYAMCTGLPPFRGSSTLAVLRLVSDTEPKPMRSENPDIPHWLEGLVRKLHAKNPAERFPSAEHVAGVLEKCLAHVQQPDQHALPAEVIRLGQPVVTPTREEIQRYHLHDWWTLLAVCLAGALFGLFVRWPSTSTTPAAPTIANEMSSSPPAAPTVAKAPFNVDPAVYAAGQQFEASAAKLREELKAMERSFHQEFHDFWAGSDSLHEMEWRLSRLSRELSGDWLRFVDDPWMQKLGALHGKVERLHQELRKHLDSTQTPGNPTVP